MTQTNCRTCLMVTIRKARRFDASIIQKVPLSEYLPQLQVQFFLLLKSEVPCNLNQRNHNTLIDTTQGLEHQSKAIYSTKKNHLNQDNRPVLCTINTSRGTLRSGNKEAEKFHTKQDELVSFCIGSQDFVVLIDLIH